MSPGFKTTLWYIGALAIVEALGLWVMDNFERVRVPEWVGYHGEARENDFLAAQRFFTAMGRTGTSVQSVYANEALPATEATVIITSDRRFMSPYQQNRLLAWARAGGDLIVEPNDDEHKDQILEAVGVRLDDGGGELAGLLPNDLMPEPMSWVSYDESIDGPEVDVITDDEIDRDEGWVEADPGDDEYESEEEQEDDEDMHVIRETEGGYGDELMHVPGTSELYKVRSIGRELVAHSPDDWQVFGRNAAFAVRESYGDGSVTAVSSLEFLRNSVIGENDHAAFMWAVLRSTGHTGEVWLINGVDPPPLWSTIATRGWPALTAIAMAIILTLWRHMPRVGAPIAPLPAVRRELMEHVDAAGRFLVDHAAGHVLIESVQRHVRQQLLRRYPQVARFAERERRIAIAKTAKLSQAEVDALYRPQVGLNRNDFVTVQRLLERISHSS